MRGPRDAGRRRGRARGAGLHPRRECVRVRPCEVTSAAARALAAGAWPAAAPPGSTHRPRLWTQSIVGAVVLASMCLQG